MKFLGLAKTSRRMLLVAVWMMALGFRGMAPNPPSLTGEIVTALLINGLLVLGIGGGAWLEERNRHGLAHLWAIPLIVLALLLYVRWLF